MSDIIKTSLNLTVKLFDSLMLAFSLSVIVENSLIFSIILIIDMKKIKIDQSSVK